jgi:hypothetical protein
MPSPAASAAATPSATCSRSPPWPARAAARRALEEQLLVERRDRKPNSPLVWTAIADWRRRGGDATGSALARDQAGQARRELLRMTASGPVPVAA